MRGILTAVWGNPGIGKSTFSAALAAVTVRKARKGIFNAILISNDRRTPALSIWAPNENETRDLGKLMEQPNITTQDVFQTVTPLKGSELESLVLLGNEKGTQIHDHSQPEEETVRRTLMGLKRYSDYGKDGAVTMGSVFVDCTTEEDPFTSVAVREADLLILLLHGDREGLAWLRSYLPIFEQLKDAGTKIIVYLRERNTFDPIAAVTKELSQSVIPMNLRNPIPESDEAHRKLVEGRLFEPYADSRYQAALDDAAAAVLEAADYVS